MDAKLPQPSPPPGATVVDAEGNASGEGAIALVYFDQWQSNPGRLDALSEMLKDKVVLVTYRQPDKIGAFGEAQLLTVADGELRRFVPLGTPESEAAIKELETLPRRRRALLADDEEEEDE